MTFGQLVSPELPRDPPLGLSFQELKLELLEDRVAALMASSTSGRQEEVVEHLVIVTQTITEWIETIETRIITLHYVTSLETRVEHYKVSCPLVVCCSTLSLSLTRV